MIKELIKGSSIYGLAPFVPKILTVLLLPILTKYLTSTDYGIIGTITSITFAVQALQDLGLRVLLPNYFYKCRKQYKIIWREIYGFLSIWMILFAIIQATLLFFFIPKEAENNRWMIILLSNFSTVFFGPTSMIGQTYFQLKLKPIPVAWRMILAGVTSIVFNFLCVVVFRWGYLGAYIGSFAGTFLANLTYWPVVNKKLGLSPIYNFKCRTMKNLLKIGIPTIPHYYSGYLMNSSNVVAMNYYGKSKGEIGHLTMAQSFFGMFESVLNAINQVWSPMSYQYIRDNNSSEMRRIMYMYILMVYSMTFLFSLWSREIYQILISNEEIAATYKYSILLVMALNYRPMYVYCINYFFYYERTVQMLGITFMAGVISCLFYFFMIPYFGVWAALFGLYAGCVFMGYSGYLYKFYKRKTIYKIKWIFYLFFQVIITISVFYFVDFSVINKIGVSLLFLLFIGYVFNIKIKRICLHAACCSHID